MKILCVADHMDPLVYSPSIKKRFADITLVLGAGDLPLSFYGFIVSMLNKPLLFIFGNHHLNEISRYRHEFGPGVDGNWFGSSVPSYGSTYIGGKVKKAAGGALIAGLGGSRNYNHGINQFSDFRMKIRMTRLFPKLIFNRIFYGRYLDVLLTHAPPKGIHDADDLCHQGFKCFLWFMRIFKPKYLIHGHVHLWDGNAKRITQYKETTVVNAYDHIVIELEN